jgi:hypothetical protein
MSANYPKRKSAGAVFTRERGCWLRLVWPPLFNLESGLANERFRPAGVEIFKDVAGLQQTRVSDLSLNECRD